MKKTLAAAFIALSLLGSVVIADDVVTPGKPCIAEHRDTLVEQIRALWSQFIGYF